MECRIGALRAGPKEPAWILSLLRKKSLASANAGQQGSVAGPMPSTSVRPLSMPLQSDQDLLHGEVRTKPG
jgi:hypothetical protein